MMSSARKIIRSSPLPRRQRGVVLLIALIVLVVMTLAGIGMMRSADTGIVIAGNLAFKQATIQAADLGISQSFDNLLSAATSASDKAVLNYSDQTGTTNCAGISAQHCNGTAFLFPGYSAAVLNACEITSNCPANQAPWWTLDATWGVNGAPAPAVAPVVNYIVDDNGTGVIKAKTAVAAGDKLLTTVRYLIHRMCTTAGIDINTTPNQCQTFTETSSAAGGSKSVGSVVFSSNSVFYRITVRSEGPRQSVSYSQSLVLIPE